MPPAQRPRWGESRHHRIVFFEKLFITCDTDSNGYMKIKVVERLFSFLALKSSFKERHAILTALDYQGDSLIQQDEFIQVLPTSQTSQTLHALAVALSALSTY